jgi:hypothetical protein
VADDKQPAPTNLVWISGLLVGMQAEGARAIGASARADAEPAIGPLAGVVLQWVVFIAWIALVAVIIGWFTRREWVRAWFAAAEHKP